MRQGYLHGLLWIALAVAPASAQDAKPFAKLEITGKYKWIHKTAFSPDGKTFAASHCHSFGPTFVTFWDATNGKRIREVSGPEGVFSWNPLVFSPDGKWLAVGGIDELLLLHADGKPAGNVSLKDTIVESVAFTPNSDVLASGCWITNKGEKDNRSDIPNVILWSVATPANKTILKRKASVRLDRERVVGVAFSPGAKTITAVGHDMDIDTGWLVRVWDVSTLKTIRTFTGKKKERYESVELSSDGRVLAVLKEDELELWNTVDGKLMRTVMIKGRGENWNMHFTKDGSAIVLVVLQVKAEKILGAEVELTDLQSGKILATKKLTSRPDDKVFGPNFAANLAGDLVAFHVDIGEIALWRSASLLGVPLRSKQKD